MQATVWVETVSAQHGADHQDPDNHNDSFRNCSWTRGTDGILHSAQENVSTFYRLDIKNLHR